MVQLISSDINFLKQIHIKSFNICCLALQYTCGILKLPHFHICLKRYSKLSVTISLLFYCLRTTLSSSPDFIQPQNIFAQEGVLLSNSTSVLCDSVRIIRYDSVRCVLCIVLMLLINCRIDKTQEWMN